MLLSNLLLENSPKNVQKYEPVIELLIDPISITGALYYMLLSILLLENSPKNVQKYEPVLRSFIDPITLRDLLFRCLICITWCYQLYC